MPRGMMGSSRIRATTNCRFVLPAPIEVTDRKMDMTQTFCPLILTSAIFWQLTPLTIMLGQLRSCGEHLRRVPVTPTGTRLELPSLSGNPLLRLSLSLNSMDVATMSATLSLMQIVGFTFRALTTSSPTVMPNGTASLKPYNPSVYGLMIPSLKDKRASSMPTWIGSGRIRELTGNAWAVSNA